MYRIIFATGNAGKMKEIREILSDLGAEILSMKEAGIRADIVEDGNTFEENALIKAKAVAALLPEGSNTAVLADDSGLEIDYLDGEPGIYSARYMGEDTSYRIKNANLIQRLAGSAGGEAHCQVCLRHCGRLSRWEHGDPQRGHRGEDRL